MPPVQWHDERRPTFRVGFQGRGSQAPSSSAFSWTLELGGRAPLRFSEVLNGGEDDDGEGRLNSDDGGIGSPPTSTTFSDEAAFMRNGVAPSAIGYDASLPKPGRPLRLNTPRYAADEASVRAILELLCPEHGEAMRLAGEELDAALVTRWLQPRAGDAAATLRALRAHVAWRTDPRGMFLTKGSTSADSSSVCSPSSSAAATPRERSGSGSGGPNLPLRRSSGGGGGGGGGSGFGGKRQSPRPLPLIPAPGAGRVDPRSIPTCLAARKACLQGTDAAGRAVVLIRAARHFMTPGSGVEDNRRLMALVLDAAFAATDPSRNPARRLLCLFDLKGLRLANCDVKVLAGIFDMLKLHYPERLDAFWFLNAPTIFWALWRVVGPMVNPGTRAKIKFLRGREAAAALAAAVPPHVLPRDLGGEAEELPVEEAVERMSRGEWPPERPLTAEEMEEEQRVKSSRKHRRSSSSGGGGGGGLLRLGGGGERGGLLLSARRQLQHLKHQHSHRHSHSHLHPQGIHERANGGGEHLRRRHSSSPSAAAAATPRGGGEGEGGGGSAIVGGRRALFAAAFAAAFARGATTADSPRSPSPSLSSSSSAAAPLTPRSAASAFLSAAAARLSALGGNSRRLVGEQQPEQQGQQQQQQQQLQQAPSSSSSPAAGGLFALLAAVVFGVLSALASVRLAAARGALGLGGGGGKPAALEEASASSPEGRQRPLSPSSIKRRLYSGRPLFRLTAVPALSLAPLRRLLSSASSSRASTRPSSAESEEPLTPLSPPPTTAPAPAPVPSVPSSSSHCIPRGAFASSRSSTELLQYLGWGGGGGGEGEGDEALLVLHEMMMMS